MKGRENMNFFYNFLKNQWCLYGMSEEVLRTYVPTFLSEAEVQEIMELPRV